MRIVFVNGQFPQTSQTFVLSQIDHALAGGDRVTVYCRLLERGVHHPIISRWDLYSRLLYAKPVDRRLLRRTAANALRHPRRYARAWRLRLAKAITWNEFFFAMQLDEAPDLFVANFGPNGLVAAKLKRHFFPRAKLAVIFHGFDVSSYVKTFGWERYRQIAPEVDLPLAVNGRWAALLAEHAGMAAEVHYLGAPIERIAPWRGHDGAACRILFVGRMTEKKGFDILAEAVRGLAAAGRDIHVETVGGGPLLKHHKMLVEDLGIAGRFTFHGARPHDAVLELMTACDVFVAPSVTAANGDSEGIPVTLMEAMACGIPVVSTIHSGIPELVTHGETGLLAPERDAAALAEAIAQLIDDPGLGRRLAEAARQRVSRDFDAGRQNDLLFTRLRHLVAAGDAPASRSS